MGAHRSVYGAHLVLSDDHGRTWRIGDVQPGVPGCSGPNESSAALGPDDELVVSIRNEHRADDEPSRALARSTDGGLTTTLEPRPDLVMPRVQSSIIGLDLAGARVLLMAGPSDPHKRADLALRHSSDGGRTWSSPWILAEGLAAYSDLALTDDGALHVLHEGGVSSPYELIAHHTISADTLRDWIETPAPAGDPHLPVVTQTAQP